MVKRKQILIMCVFLTAATFIAFWRVTHCEFMNYDDPDYITENSHIQNGMAMVLPIMKKRIFLNHGRFGPLIEVCRKRARIPVTTSQDCSKMPSVAVAERGIAAIGGLKLT
jgi:hypothetical protein